MLNYKKLLLTFSMSALGLIILVVPVQAQTNINPPDLIISSITFSATKQGEVGKLAVTVKNIGGDLYSGSGLLNGYNNFSSQKFVFDSATPSITQFKTDRPVPGFENPLRTNETITFYWYGSFDTSGNLYIYYKVDNGDELYEQNEDNNSLSATVVIQKLEQVVPEKKPDLTVTSITFSATKQGEVGKLAVTIKNIGGDLYSGAGLLNGYNNFSSQKFVFDSATPSITQFKTDRPVPGPGLENPLRTNESITFYWYGSFDTSGNLYIYYKVDNANELDEQNENNNSLSTTVVIQKLEEVAPEKKVDLEVTGITFNSDYVGEKGTVSVNIKNIGTAPLTSSRGLLSTYFNLPKQAFVYDADTPAVSLFTSRPLPSISNPLNPGATISRVWRGTFTRAGNHYLEYRVDNGNELDELNENNNFYTTVITIKPYPEKEVVTQGPINSVNTSTDTTTSANKLINNKLDEVLAEINQLRNIIKEQEVKIKYLSALSDNMQKLSLQMESAINSFITYGADVNTEKLGAGERAAVMYSYKNAFGSLPRTENELVDAIKIANGRWPSITNQNAENRAKAQFEKIYLRSADMSNLNDNAAITVMAYGLRQKAENRNLKSEETGINIFKNIYGRIPSSTEDWNIMQAITYSGAQR